MKTLFVSIYDSAIAANILRAGVLDELLKQNSDVHVVIIADTVRAEEYRRLFGSDRVTVEEVERDTSSRFEQLWVSFVWHTVSSDTLSIQLCGGPLSPKRRWWVRVATYILRFIFGNVPGRYLLRWLDGVMFRRRPYAALFNRYHPDAVFATNVYAQLDVDLLREAKRCVTPTIGMVKSWDNITSRGLIRQHPERWVVQTNIMRNDLQNYADAISDSIAVSGVPKYDMYFLPDNEERISFWKRYGVDGSKKVILYLEPGIQLAPHGHEIWPMLDEFISKGKIHEAVDLFISVHPAYRIREDIAQTLTHAKVVRFGYRLQEKSTKSWEFSKEAMRDLMRSVRYCDLVITSASTMNIESSIFDKPIINIAFDGTRSLPYQESIRQYYDYSHLKPIVHSGGVKVAHSPGELLEQINFLLAHPEWGREGRRHIVGDQCVYEDGKAAERIAKAVLAHMERSG